MKKVMIYFCLMFSTLCLSINLINAQNIDLYGSRMGNFDTVSGYNDMIFLKIDPFTAIESVIDTLTNVRGILTGSTTFDHSNQHYIFVGDNYSGSNSLFVLDINGTILSENPSINNISGFQYDLKNQVLYALLNDSQSIFHFIIFNPDSGTFVPVNTLNNVQAVSGGTITFNSNTSKYIFAGGHRLYVINAQNGTIESNSALGNGSLSMLEYDNNVNKLFGLYKNNSVNPYLFYFTEIDTLTAGITIIDSLNEIKSIATTSSVYDQANSLFMFVGTDSLWIKRFYVINSNTGQIISNSPIDHNIGEIECDNTNYAFYKYHYTYVKNMFLKEDNCSIYPNPSNGTFRINFTEEKSQEVIISITNRLNQVVFSKTYNNHIGTFSNSIELKNIADGIYNVTVKIGDRITTKKILIIQ